jgi:quercetin dioxygenase-like cupin family protein
VNTEPICGTGIAEARGMAPVHVTSGSDRRQSHVLSGQGLVYRLADEVKGLADDLGRASGGRSAKTLAKSDGLRVTLVMLEQGATLEPEAAAGGASLQLLSGSLEVQIDHERVALSAGELMILSNNLREPIKAQERSAFLLTVAWPVGAGAWDQEESSGHL